MPKDFKLPDLGEGISEAQIIRVMVKEGDNVSQDQYLMEVETDKAAVEIPSPYSGVVKKVHVAAGQTVNVGSVIVSFDETGADAGGKAAGGAAPVAAPAKGQPREQAAPAKGEAREPAARGDGASRGPAAAAGPVKSETRAAVAAGGPAAAEAGPSRGPTTAAAAPAVRKLARELNVDLDAITGSGPGGRVTKEDVEQAASGAKAPAGEAQPAPAGGPSKAAPGAAPARIAAAPAVLPPGTDDKDAWGNVRHVPLSQIRKTIAKQMSRSAYTIPHVTHIDEVDISRLEELRGELNEATGGDPKITVMCFVIRALCIALRQHPVFNSSFDEENGRATYKQYVNIGIAVDTPRGLIVPVIRNADTLSLAGIAGALRGIADRARTNQFAIEDLRGGTFTVTNVGALGGLFSTPIINYPEVAILGMGKSRRLPVFDGEDTIREAQMLPLSLSFDHRATDGANAARFVGDVIQLLANPAMFMLH